MTRETKAKKFEIISDGRTVWVNGGDGGCLARFSKFGIDIHLDTEGQMASGRQCLDCTHSLPDADGWTHFVASVRQHHGVALAPKHRPAWLPVPASSVKTA